MRRALNLVLIASLAGTALWTADVHAQQRRGTQEEEEKARAEQRKRMRQEAEDKLVLPEYTNAGPCPYVKVLYDAARSIEFVQGRRASNAVAYSGEIDGVAANCTYAGGDPIKVTVITSFSFGRGPQATTYYRPFGYWIAVTDRNKTVLAKERFGVGALFPRGADRVTMTDTVQNIVIPRVNDKVSGENFEILVGFDVTPEMAAFNRDGTRFLVTATAGDGGQVGAAAPKQ